MRRTGICVNLSLVSMVQVWEQAPPKKQDLCQPLAPSLNPRADTLTVIRNVSTPTTSRKDKCSILVLDNLDINHKQGRHDLA